MMVEGSWFGAMTPHGIAEVGCAITRRTDRRARVGYLKPQSGLCRSPGCVDQIDCDLYTYGFLMRVKIEIDDAVPAEAMRATVNSPRCAFIANCRQSDCR
jgi:hypothetical protein